MATSLHGRKIMKEEKNAAKSNACRNLIDPSKVPPNHSLSYFLSITITQPPKIRIKIPQKLMKTMQRSEDVSSGGDGNDNNKEMKKKQVEPRKQLLSKVGRIFFHVFGRRKTQDLETCSSDDDDSDFAHDHKECTIKSSKNDVNDADEEEEKGKKKRQQQPKQGRVQGQSSFKSLFNKRIGLASVRGKIAGENTKNSENGAVGATVVIERQESSHYVARVPSRILTTRQRLKMARSVRKIEQEDGGRVLKAADELCKKRILIGEKCKPLNNSGTLQYDEDGVLLPEIIP